MRRDPDASPGSGAAAVLLAAALWSMLGTSYALIQRHVAIDDVTLVTLRAVGGAVLAVAWFGWRDPAVFAIRASDTARMILFGLISVSAFYLALILAFRHSSVAIGTLLLYLAPAVVTIGAALWLDDPLTRKKLLALALSFVGLLLVVEVWRTGGTRVSLAGVAFGLASAVTYGSYSLMGKPLTARYAPGTLLVWTLSTGALGLLAVKLAISPGEWPPAVPTLGIAIWCGLALTLLPFALYTVGLSRIPASEASIIATIEPVLAMVFAMSLLGERVGPVQMLGAACVIGSVFVLATRKRSSRSPRWASLTTAARNRAIGD
jgi:drug/metabolite transporter (DMT)-like permease